MPSISNSKVEKQPSLDIQEPQSKVQLLIENKIRNLEKRKSRLEQLEEERKSGKELNQDQRKAIKKYEEVVEMLEFFKEFKKSVQAIFSEYNRALKEKTAKENKLRHHKELERLRTIILFQDVLNSVTRDTVRNDFLNGTNGAIQLAPEKLNHLEELNKVVHLDRTRTDVALTKQINQVAERYMSLVEGKKTPEVIKGVTYEEIKETLTVINDCGYLDSKTKKTNSNSSSVAPSTAIKPTPVAPASSAPSQHSVERQEGTTSVTSSYETTKHQHHSQQSTQQQPNAISSDIHTSRSNDMNTQSVGVKQYTQKSRLEGAPHMDPAVLAMGPVPSYPPTFGNKQAVEALAAQLSGIPMSSASMSSKGVTIYETTGGHQPIPSQTFTNQRFAAMMTGGTYVQPVHPSMLPASSFSIQNPGIAMSGQNTMGSHHNVTDHQQLHQQQMGMIDPNSAGSNQGQPMMGGGLTSQTIGGYESEATFTQFQAPVDTNRGNQAASRDKQNFHDDGSGFGSHYGQYRRNPRGGGGNRGSGNQGGQRSGNRSYQPMNGYSSRSNNRGGGGPGQGGMVRSSRPKQGVPQQENRNMANSANWLGQ